MTPFFFGERTRRLYGAYHPAASGPGPARAVVLCPPWGPEYTEAHRTLRQLAVLLAAAGVHTLRFDYFGTGDSGGEIADGDLDGWRADIWTAAEELRDISGAARVTLAGLRLGALLAAGAAAERPRDVDRLVLWDPIDTGRDYIEELGEIARRHYRLTMLPIPRPAEAGGGYEVFGFPVGEALVRQIAVLDLSAAARQVAAPILLVISGDDQDLAHAARALGDDGRVTAVHVPAPPCWIEDNRSAPGFIPHPVLQAIVGRLA